MFVDDTVLISVDGWWYYGTVCNNPSLPNYITLSNTKKILAGDFRNGNFVSKDYEPIPQSVLFNLAKISYIIPDIKVIFLL